jgi:PAS domain S-box-containing protein
MASEAPKDRNLYKRGQFLTALNRWLLLGIGLLALFYLWSAPGVQAPRALGIAGAYAVFTACAQLWQRREGGRNRGLKVTHDVVDALAIGAGAACTGGMRSPVWLFLYPHIMAVSVRGGLAYAMAMGLLDAVIVIGLGQLDPGSRSGSLSGLHAVALLWCGFIGGTVSSYLHEVQARLAKANTSLRAQNEQLEQTLRAAEESRARQEQALLHLRESEERYRHLLERIQDGVAILSEGRIVFVNQVFARIAGDTPGGLVGVDLQELIPPEDRQEIQERYRRWQESQAETGELETRLRTRQGTLLTVALRVGAVVWEGRRSMITTVRDITRERRMEQELKAHSARLAAINEIANAVNQSLTIEDIFEVAAAEARRIVTLDRLTIALLDPNSPAVELVSLGPGTRRQRAPFRREDVAWAFRRATAWTDGGEDPLPHRLHELIADPDVRSAATIPLLSKERVIGALGLGRYRAQPFSAAELALIEPVASHIAIALDNARLLETVSRRGREFESLVEIGRRIVERLELEGILPLVTRSVNRILGTNFCLLMLKQGARLELAAQEGLEPEVAARFQMIPVGESLTGRVAAEGRPLIVSDMRKDTRSSFSDVVNEYGYCSFLCVPLLRRGEVLGTLEVVTKEFRSFGPEDQDILTAFADATAVALDHARLFRETRQQMSELADANRRLEELDKLRQEYLRNVSHEFRTPLTVIRGYAEYLRGAGAPDEAALKDVMRIVVESCDRVIDMVDTLIEVSRIEQGSAAQTLHVQTLDVREVLQSSLEPLRPQAEKKGLRLALELPDRPLRAQGDGGLLQQVVRKLVDNAIKYSAKDARIAISGRDDSDHVLLLVKDEGVGIAAEHLPRIFEKFYMVDGGLTRRVGGTGVGLYLVREIVRLHGGSVAVESEPGRGSLFTVRVPKTFTARPGARP